MHHIGMSTAPSLYADLAYDPLEDFKTVGLVTEVPMTIVARKDFEPETMEEFVDYVKENADTVTLANAGIGAASHLCGLLLQDALGEKLTEVPYEGTGPALTDLVGGQVDIMCDQTTNTTGQILGGEIKAYAVTTPERVESLSDLPTTEEEGLEDLQVGVWHGLYVPVETPDEIVEKLTAALKVALADKNVIDELAELGATPSSEDDATPEAHTSGSRSRSNSGGRSSRTPASLPTDRSAAVGRQPPHRCPRTVRVANVVNLHDARKDLLAGGTFVGFGLAFAITSSTYGVGSGLRMGAGFFPLVLGSLLVVLGILIAVKGFVAADSDDIGPVPWKALALLVTALLFFGFTVRGLGLVPALLVAVFLSGIGGTPRPRGPRSRDRREPSPPSRS